MSMSLGDGLASNFMDSLKSMAGVPGLGFTSSLGRFSSVGTPLRSCSLVNYKKARLAIGSFSGKPLSRAMAKRLADSQMKTATKVFGEEVTEQGLTGCLFSLYGSITQYI